MKNKKTKVLKHTADELKVWQQYPLSLKIRLTKARIREWVNKYGEDGVYISFSGGKDSAVLVHICKQMYPNIPVVFINTGLEWPQVRQHAINYIENDNLRYKECCYDDEVTELSSVLRPLVDFKTVLTVYGYPIISKEVSEKIASYRKGQPSAIKSFIPGARDKRYDYSKHSYLLKAPFYISAECCTKTKKEPAKLYESQTGRKPIVATMAYESQLRAQKWLQKGCLDFDADRPIAKPMSFWTEQDVLCYIKLYGVDIASVYGDIIVKNTHQSMSLFDLIDHYDTAEEMPIWALSGCQRTGCIFCAYGATHDKRPNRYELLDVMGNKNLRDYCMRGGAFDSDGMWKPDNRGLGFWFVLEYMNRHGNAKIFIPEYEHYQKTFGTARTKQYLSV